MRADKFGRKKMGVVKKELAKIRKKKGGKLKPADVVAAAKPKKSPLHDYFEWDDTEAAKRFRLRQAAELIRVTVTVIKGKEVREYVSLTTDRSPGGGSYRLTAKVLTKAEQRAQMLEDALAELEAFEKKYKTLSELAEVFEAANRAKAAAKTKGSKAKIKRSA